MTALYGAVGRTIDSVGRRLAETPESERPEHQRSKYSWEFVLLAANQDAVVAGGRRGIAPDRTASLVAGSDGPRGAFRAQRAAASSMRASGTLRSGWAKDPSKDDGEDEDES
jgi:hypothetical protein